MWKDYLYLNKKEKTAFWSFTILIIILQSAIWTSEKWLPAIAKSLISEKDLVRDSIGIQQLNSIDNSLTGSSKSGLSGERYKGKSGLSEKIKLNEFDPNTADSQTFVSLGIKSFIVKNIIKYRNKGGVFRKPEDFSKIYGLDKSTFEALSPYIYIGSKGSNVKETNDENKYKLKNDSVIQSLKITESGTDITPEILITTIETETNLKSFSFELNSADTSDLQLLKGVGSVTASMITRYGGQLGGYHDVSQLSEIKGLYPNVLAGLQKSLTVNPMLIKKLNVNKASLEKLKAHPYLDFYQAKVIINLRSSRKGIKDLNELLEFKEFNKDNLEKLKWYLEI